ncbi:PqqD family protein [Chitinophaga vietnamensis]|uniref:PqqD family protein n=1 Tax=Chitinophaga vietnamensis TaxID=2593957 RepID=UPI001178818E|nr:PqqD family protein [Chitinophaga vietnamensis]
MIFSGKKIKISENSIVREMGAGFVILNLNTERFYELNEVGKRFWELLSDDQEYASALHILQDEYEVSIERLQEDIPRLIESLKNAELIVID